ncbi:MAG: TM2 domain-containing protein [Bacteroidales bacterium]|nr:TM2 domain-containing protein [Bacteroidales bacterium]
MKKAILLIAALTAFSAALMAEDGKYVLNNAAIENAFAQAEEISVDNIGLFSQQAFDLFANTSSQMPAAYRSSVNPWVSWALCWVLGEFGVHRHYMGTSRYMWATYTFTCCGIFGIVPLVDWVVLLVGAIQGDIRDYENNTKFFMWF